MTPAINVQDYVPLAPLTTFLIGGKARYFGVADDEVNVAAAVGIFDNRGEPFFVLGGGSNVLISDNGFPGFVLHVKIRGIKHLGEGLFEVGAGENWDGFVQQVVAQGFAGVECLAGIPGSVGGTPVQNVGAYGQEVSETIVQVKAFDRRERVWVELDRSACNFRYRASLFNTDEPNRYIVTKVRFQLRPGGAPTLKYADLQKKFADAATPPTLLETADAVREIRRSKGMLLVLGDPNTQSAGSYFKNPIVPEGVLVRVAEAAGMQQDDIPHWAAGEGLIKLPAAWLLEHAGFQKGFGLERSTRLSMRHTLALTNRGEATCASVLKLEAAIEAGVEAKFGVKLEREPVLVGG